MNASRKDLEAKALRNVCPCWYHTLAGSIEETSDEELQLVIDDSMAYHYENQKHDPVSPEEFAEELKQCQDYRGV